jgi:hypothetical protein
MQELRDRVAFRRLRVAGTPNVQDQLSLGEARHDAERVGSLRRDGDVELVRIGRIGCVLRATPDKGRYVNSRRGPTGVDSWSPGLAWTHLIGGAQAVGAD